MRVAVIGTGYVGLISGVCLADVGHEVTCVDLNANVVEKLNAEIPTIHEEGLPELIKKVVRSGNFRATDQIDMALEAAEIVLVAVGTPSNQGAIDLSFIGQACKSIGSYIQKSEKFLSVVIKSTVIPGTTDTFVKRQLEKASGKKLGEFGLGMNPEFLREGSAIRDFANPDRIVLGYEDSETLNKLKELYSSWNVDKLSMSSRSAELVKYANNALLATQISVINEIANLSSKLGGINFSDVCAGVHSDKRWSPILESGHRIKPEILTYLVPGCGFGGSCFPKDVQALRTQGVKLGLNMQLLNAVLDVNERQTAQVASILERKLGSLLGKRILILGLSFKPGTDDVRESPSLRLIPDFVTRGATVFAHDPVAIEPFRDMLGSNFEGASFVENWENIIPKIDVIVLATAWEEYLRLAKLDIAGKTVFDCRSYLIEKNLDVLNYFEIGSV
ncbi:UDP-glucose/GDP-mannose dehydrogenase family protein [Alphaproteobacteria bacterium]|nr:UDP-glucose/GDP-mannose dehydrogenase family protein [Alphaproteobacteria bacterium]